MNLRKNLALALLILPFLSLAQERESQALPIFSPLPYYSISDSIVGWSFSSDGQWVQWPNIIPPIGISRNEEFYEAKHNQFGIDNIQKLMAYHVKYGKDTLVCVVKTYKNGEYKYPARKRGWHSYLDAYYNIVYYRDFKKAINYFEKQNDEEVHVLRIRSVESRLLSDIKERDLLEEIIANTIIKPTYDRNMVLTLQNNKKEKTLHFHFSNLHEIFNDVEGVRMPFSRRGRSVYGSSQLFDYMYFEIDKNEFLKIIDLKAALLQEELDAMDSEEGNNTEGSDWLNEESGSEDDNSDDDLNLKN